MIKIKIKNIKIAPYTDKGYFKPMGNFILSGKIPQLFPFTAKPKSVIIYSILSRNPTKAVRAQTQ